MSDFLSTHRRLFIFIYIHYFSQACFTTLLKSMPVSASGETYRGNMIKGYDSKNYSQRNRVIRHKTKAFSLEGETENL